jgi:hypothetical protein
MVPVLSKTRKKSASGACSGMRFPALKSSIALAPRTDTEPALSWIGKKALLKCDQRYSNNLKVSALALDVAPDPEFPMVFPSMRSHPG